MICLGFYFKIPKSISDFFSTASLAGVSLPKGSWAGPGEN